MKWLILSSSPLLVRMAVMFYLSSGNMPQINRSDLLLWHITLCAAISDVGWRPYDCFPPYRSVIRRTALRFIVLIVPSEVAPEVFR